MMTERVQYKSLISYLLRDVLSNLLQCAKMKYKKKQHKNIKLTVKVNLKE